MTEQFILNENDTDWAEFIDFIDAQEYEVDKLLAMLCALVDYIEDTYGITAESEVEPSGPRLVH